MSSITRILWEATIESQQIGLLQTSNLFNNSGISQQFNHKNEQLIMAVPHSRLKPARQNIAPYVQQNSLLCLTEPMD